MCFFLGERRKEVVVFDTVDNLPLYSHKFLETAQLDWEVIRLHAESPLVI